MKNLIDFFTIGIEAVSYLLRAIVISAMIVVWICLAIAVVSAVVIGIPVAVIIYISNRL